MKVHKLTILIVDTDDLGAASVKTVLEGTRYPNHCIGPQVMQIETAEVEWDDAHPLNQHATQASAFAALFPGAEMFVIEFRSGSFFRALKDDRGASLADARRFASRDDAEAFMDKHQWIVFNGGMVVTVRDRLAIEARVRRLEQGASS